MAGNFSYGKLFCVGVQLVVELLNSKLISTAYWISEERQVDFVFYTYCAGCLFSVGRSPLVCGYFHARFSGLFLRFDRQQPAAFIEGDAKIIALAKKVTISKKSTIFVQFPWNLVKLTTLRVSYFDQVSWGWTKIVDFLLIVTFLASALFF